MTRQGVIATSSSLAVDVGQTTTRILTADARTITVAVGATRVVDRETAELAVGRIADAIASAHVAPGGFTGVGLSGYPRNPALAHYVARRLSTAIACESVVVADDVYTGYLGALRTESGVAVTAGTGAVALAVNGTDRWARSGGTGYLLGDEGGGYWIGQQGLRAALAYTETNDGSANLATILCEEYGSADALTATLYSNSQPQRLVSAFAIHVARLAESGDRLCTGILHRAAHHLAELTRRVYIAAGLTNAPIALTGALVNSAILSGMFKTALECLLPTATVVGAYGNPLDGAAQLCDIAPPLLIPDLATVHAGTK